MTRYYFDWHESGEVESDAIGLDFPTLADAKLEAARALAERFLDVLPSADKHDLAITVRDSEGVACAIATLVFGSVVVRNTRE